MLRLHLLLLLLPPLPLRLVGMSKCSVLFLRHTGRSTGEYLDHFCDYSLTPAAQIGLLFFCCKLCELLLEDFVSLIGSFFSFSYDGEDKQAETTFGL